MVMLSVVPGTDPMLTWVQWQVVAESVSSVAIVCTLLYSVWSYRTTLRDSYYAEIDRVYFELLKLGLERPYLLDYPQSPEAGRAREYDAYAFMVWNFVETVFDRCQGRGKRRLRETWYPVIEAETLRHRHWFERPGNRAKFKDRFRRFVDSKFPPRVAPDDNAGALPS
jgi:hypothetical protein